MKSLIIYSSLVLSMLFAACKKEKNATADDKQPQIVSIWPNSGVGATIITIYGKNFSTNPLENQVKFNGKDAIILETSEGQLQVVTPEDGVTGTVTVIVKGKELQGPLFSFLENPDEYSVSTFAGNGTPGLQNGIGENARFRNIEGAVFDLAGNLIITDRGNHCIRKVSPAGEVTTIAGTGTAGYLDGDVSVAKFSNPWKSAVDAQGNIYVADRDNHRVRKISTTGVVSTLAGAGSSGFADGQGTSAKFNQPIDVAIDKDGNVFVADNSNHRIRKITPTGTVTTVAGNGTGAFADGTGVSAQFKNPSGIYFDASGNLIVADRGNHRVRKITVAGEVTTIAGAGTAGFADGNAETAKFSDPYGVSLDEQGNIYIADLNNQKIRKINKQGMVTTVAGSSAGYTNGIGNAAQFSSPVDLTVDAAGNIYVADNSNHTLRKIRLVK